MFHWDGFSSAKTSLKNCWTVDLSILNCGRENTLDPIPIMFIPSSSEKIIKQADPHVLTAFLKPLMTDLERVFVDGFPVQYAYPIELISECMFDDLPSGLATLRAIVMVWTGDHPAQCKVGAVKSGGYSGCRRHYVISRWRARSGNKGLVEYHDNRKHRRHPSAMRCVTDMTFALKQWQELPIGRERDEVGHEAGISGQSCLWRLYNLYGFDISQDLTYDVMHTLSLCVFKKYVHMLVKYAARNGKIKDLDGALQTVKNLSPARLGARWPRSAESLGFYKAEEYQIFVMWCLPHVLDHLDLGLDSILGGIGAVLTEVGRLFYTHSRSYGWTFQSRQNARELLAAWRVRLEESVGPNSSPLEHVAGIHSKAVFFGLSSVKVTTFLLKMMARCFAGFLVAKSHISLFERLQTLNPNLKP